MRQTHFRINGMDCPTEEQMIRMKLEDADGIIALDFDLEGRTLKVIHEGDPGTIKNKLDELDMGTVLVSTTETTATDAKGNDAIERRILWSVLLINLAFFAGEMLTGFLSRSMGLVADSLDMLADSLVYGMSLFAVGAAVSRKKRVARWSGYFQLALALLGFSEVIRRFFGIDVPPDHQTMIIVSALALGGNSLCLYLLQRARSEDAHMKASMIFTSNDIIVNLGVITAGVLVLLTSSQIPDLVVGAVVFMVVFRGAARILKLAH